MPRYIRDMSTIKLRVMRRKATSLTVTALSAICLLTTIGLGGAPSAVALKTYQCQHPLTTGQEAFHLRNVSPTAACKAVRALARFIENGSRAGQLYRCVGLTMSHPGRPVLKVHHLAGSRTSTNS
jgi:hypothetical protein